MNRAAVLLEVKHARWFCICVFLDSFKKYDVDHSGCIDAWELKEAMKSLGQNPTDDELFALLAQVDTVSLDIVLIRMTNFYYYSIICK